MTEIKLLLNSDKTEAMLTDAKSKVSNIFVSSLQLDITEIPVSDQVKSLDIILSPIYIKNYIISFILFALI